MSFDPMAAAVDWLDAYRALDIESILEMYADDAVIDCGCGRTQTITGKDALRAYWEDRFLQFPVSELDDLQPSFGETVISYVSGNNAVRAVLTFNALGQIAAQTCGTSRSRPTADVTVAAL